MEKLNIAKLLRDCPKDMELNCVMYDDVYFDYVDDLNIIHCYIKQESLKTTIMFNQHGTPNNIIKSKCVIFPKGKTTWEEFVPPCKVKDGDIVATNSELQVFILQRAESNTKGYCYIGYDFEFNVLFDAGVWEFDRLATEEEKQKLFDAIKEKGYKWNPKNKTLEKLPKFKVGDRVIRTATHETYMIDHLTLNGYVFKNEGETGFIFEDEHLYELVPNKFDINTLVPFESKVLVRDTEKEKWKPAIWGYYDVDHIKGYPYETVGGNCFSLCIPYEGNEHLFGTTNDCNDFYKTW